MTYNVFSGTLNPTHFTYNFCELAVVVHYGHCTFALWFLLLSFFLLLFSSPNLSRRRLDVYHTSTHDVTLVRI